MLFFKASTRGRHIIMGRLNYESIPEKYRPLPGRHNIVISRNTKYDASEATLVTSLESALDLARKSGESETFIIGGGQIYSMALDAGVVDTMYITHVHGEPEGDAFFPEFDREEWTLTVLDEHPADQRHEFHFTICKYDRK